MRVIFWVAITIGCLSGVVAIAEHDRASVGPILTVISMVLLAVSTWRRAYR